MSSPVSCSNWANTSPCFPNVTVDNHCSALLVLCCLPVCYCFHIVSTWFSSATDTETPWTSGQGWEMLGVSGLFPCLWPDGQGGGGMGGEEGATAQVGQGGLNTLLAPESKLLAA